MLYDMQAMYTRPYHTTFPDPPKLAHKAQEQYLAAIDYIAGELSMLPNSDSKVLLALLYHARCRKHKVVGLLDGGVSGEIADSILISQQALKEFCALDVQTVVYSLRSLEDAGLIHAGDYVHPRGTTYTLTFLQRLRQA